MKNKRPSFRKPRSAQAYESPEELFGKLSNRAKSHGYLRTAQGDALREYMKHTTDSDIAFELPTGTGKTGVGLLIAEWHRRRTGSRVAYLTLTNQLAAQALREADKLGIYCADVTGTKETRKASEVGRYQAGQAVGITTYSNLFNINPVVQPSNLLVFDDAHGGEHFVSDMWTVRITNDDPDLYSEALTAVRPGLTDSQYQLITDESQYGAVELVDILNHPEVMSELIRLIDSKEEGTSIHYSWTKIRSHLHSCLVFASSNEIVVRPIIPPTHTHQSFWETKQRIYMSATLGGEGDLLRSYGVTSITSIRAQHAQWGKRYIFIPGLYLEDNEGEQLVSDIWNGLKTRRALLLAPSFNVAQKVSQAISSKMNPGPSFLGARDIENSLDGFTEKNNTMLCLAGRYDGLDLPGDDCRLLIIAESPGAVGTLERHQRERWKLGPLLRRRERTRLIQGMGRCTRDATDFAVIILMGQSLINSITNSTVVQGFPGEIQRELKWGITQSEVAGKDKDALTEMMLGILEDSEYRKDANESLEEIIVPDVVPDSISYDKTAKLEVQFARVLWEGNFSKAHELAREAADNITEADLSGYRAWWFYLGSMAAHLFNDSAAEIDCLKRARATGINTGFLDHLIRKNSGKKEAEKVGDVLDRQVETVWQRLEQWGWHGPKFSTNLKEMKDGLASLSNPSQYHIGLERLGQCLGAETTRPGEKGSPDVVWIFSNQCFVFEAKSDKKTDSSLSKKEIQQAKGHPDWLKSKRADLADVPIWAVVVSPTNRLDSAAQPHAADLYYASTDAISGFAANVASALAKIRIEFAGKEYAATLPTFKVRISQSNLHLAFIEKQFGTPLKGK